MLHIICYMLYITYYMLYISYNLMTIQSSKMSLIPLIIGCVREDSRLHQARFEKSRHMLGPMGRDRLSRSANSAFAPSSHVHRDKCASSPPTRSY